MTEERKQRIKEFVEDRIGQPINVQTMWGTSHTLVAALDYAVIVRAKRGSATQDFAMDYEDFGNQLGIE